MSGCGFIKNQKLDNVPKDLKNNLKQIEDVHLTHKKQIDYLVNKVRCLEDCIRSLALKVGVTHCDFGVNDAEVQDLLFSPPPLIPPIASDIHNKGTSAEPSKSKNKHKIYR